MNKKAMILLLVMTHLLCVLIGFGIAKAQPKAVENSETIDITESKVAEETDIPIEYTASAEEVTPPEEEQPETKESEENIPSNTQPTQTQPKETQPAETQPKETMPEEEDPSVPEIPEIDVGENGLPIL